MLNRNNRNVILVGPMGVGKSTIGRLLAKQLRLEFHDSDDSIEQKTGVSISTIFDIEGEAGFRMREEAMIEQLCNEKGIVLSTGGGAILSPKNRAAMHKSGLIVYLSASVDMQLERTRNSKNRPLLENGDRRVILENLASERAPLYRQEADLEMATDNRSAQWVARELTKKVMQQWAI